MIAKANTAAPLVALAFACAAIGGFWYVATHVTVPDYGRALSRAEIAYPNAYPKAETGKPKPPSS